MTQKEHMRTLRPFIARALFFSTLLSLPALAASRDKVGNGGQTVDINGRPSLRDLVDNSVCVWYTGAQFVGGLSRFTPALASLERVDAIYSTLLRGESERVKVCLTGGTLTQIPAEDMKGLTIWENVAKRQVAIRVNERVYIDSKIFAAMDEPNKAYLMVHELLHGYIAQDVKDRNTKLRSFVRFLRDHESQPISFEFLATQIEMNEVDWPYTQEAIGLIESLEEPVMRALDSTLTPTRRAEAYDLYVYRSRAAAKGMNDRTPEFVNFEIFKRMHEKTLVKLEATMKSFGAAMSSQLESFVERDDAAGFEATLATHPASSRDYAKSTAFLVSLAQRGKMRIFATRLEDLRGIAQEDLLDQLSAAQLAPAVATLVGKPTMTVPTTVLFSWIGHDGTFAERAVGLTCERFETYHYRNAETIDALLHSPNANLLLRATHYGRTPLDIVEVHLRNIEYRMKTNPSASQYADCAVLHNYWEDVKAVLVKHGATVSKKRD